MSARPKAYKQNAEAMDAFKKTSPSVWRKSARSVLPACNTEAMQLRLNEIATKITPGVHAILLLDQVPRPSRFGATSRSCSSRHARLNSTAKKISGSSLRQNWRSNRIFKSFDDIVDHCCYAWNTLIDQPWKIMSIARRDWAAAGKRLRAPLT